MRTATLTLAAIGTLALGACGIQEHNVPMEPGSGFAGAGGSSGPGGAPGGAGGAGGGSGGAAGSGSSTGGSSGSGSGGSAAGGSAGSRGGSSGGAGQSGSGGQAGWGSSAQGGAGGSPPASGGLMLGGMQVPRERAVVILHFGHSNMLGQAEDPEELRPYFFTPQPRLWTYRGNAMFPAAVEPTASRNQRDTAGPGMGLLKAAAALAPQDYHFISVGFGVGSATSQDWSKGGLHYSRVMDLAVQLKGRVTFGAAVIMLGITNRHMPAAQQPGFANRVVKIAADVRANLETPNLPILHTDYEVESTGSLAVDGPVGRLFRPLIQMLPSRIPNCAIVPTDMLGMQDDHHFDMAGQKEWADRAIKILVDKGWAPWTVAR